MTKSESAADWIKEGEKYALIGISLNSGLNDRSLILDAGLSVLPREAFQLPEFWREALGSIGVESVERCNLFLVAKTHSNEVNDTGNEDRVLKRRVGDFFTGLTLVSKFSAYEMPFVATGQRVSDKIDVKSFQELHCPLGSIVEDKSSIDDDKLLLASKIGLSLNNIASKGTADYWRFLRVLSVYQSARADSDILERIHQFARCIEGLIDSNAGKTKRQFKSRTELFLGPTHHPRMGEIYETRSDVEHLNEHKRLSDRTRDARIHLATLEAVSEWIARSCLARIILEPQLMEYFRTADNIHRFWAEDPEKRQCLWGSHVDPEEQLRNFEFDWVSDELLGIISE